MRHRSIGATAICPFVTGRVENACEPSSEDCSVFAFGTDIGSFASAGSHDNSNSVAAGSGSDPAIDGRVLYLTAQRHLAGFQPIAGNTDRCTVYVQLQL